LNQAAEERRLRQRKGIGKAKIGAFRRRKQCGFLMVLIMA
jgi:hypothetical protein